MMESDEGKLFVGGLGWYTTEEKLRGYFSQYGEITHAMIMHDRNTGSSRGFAFVVFSDPSVIDTILHQDKHIIDGRPVDAKRAEPRKQQQSLRLQSSADGDSKLEGNFRTRKIFVGGLPSSLTGEEFIQYFQEYGNVTDAVIMFDRKTGHARGFGFITYDSEDTVDKVVQKCFHDLKDKSVEVKRALPKAANPAGNGHGGGYLGYASSGPIRFPQSNVGCYTPYNGYADLNYGYGYDLYNYYGGAAGVYGNPAYASYGYASSSLPGTMRNQWSSPYHGYGALYDPNASYGATSSWYASANSGAVSASTSKSQAHASENGNKENGYSIHIGNEGSLAHASENGNKENDYSIHIGNEGSLAHASENGNKENGYSIHIGNEGTFTDCDGNESGDQHTGNAPKSRTGQHEANGHNTARICGSSNDSPEFPDAACDSDK